MVHLKAKAMPKRQPNATERKDTMFPFTRLKGSGVSVLLINSRVRGFNSPLLSYE